MARASQILETLSVEPEEAVCLDCDAIFDIDNTNECPECGSQNYETTSSGGTISYYDEDEDDDYED